MSLAVQQPIFINNVYKILFDGFKQAMMSSVGDQSGDVDPTVAASVKISLTNMATKAAQAFATAAATKLCTEIDAYIKQMTMSIPAGNATFTGPTGPMTGVITIPAVTPIIT